MTEHTPVLIDGVLKNLGDIRGRTILDCTFGAGGYSRAFLAAGANVIAFDRDPSVIGNANAVGAQYPDNFKFVLAPFSEISRAVCVEPDAIVFDLGISSMQIDKPDRRFSFRYDAPLDMRMNQTKDGKEQRADELIANSSVDDLTQILREYGDVKKARPIALAMKEKLPRTTFELKGLIHNPKDIAPVFQALRIAVNDEIGEIRRALADVPNLLVPGGTCVCITFHSLEDRLVKNIFREWSSVAGDPRMPAVSAAKFRLLRPLQPSTAEISQNPRARSAHMRAVVKSY